jgi:hypothetical protein
MSTLSEDARRIANDASKHGGCYLLPWRYRIPAAWQEKTILDQEYAACDELVDNGYARRLGYSASAPGIVLTGKPVP